MPRHPARVVDAEDFDVKKSRAMPDWEQFPALLQLALENICEEQLFNDERGFQGALLQELGRRPEDLMLRQEYQFPPIS